MSKSSKEIVTKADMAAMRRERQENVRDKIAKERHHVKILECIKAVDDINPDDEHANFLMSKVQAKFNMHLKLLNKVVGDVKAVELTTNGSDSGSSQAGVSRAIEIIGELVSRGSERDITPSRPVRSVVSSQVSAESEGPGGSEQPGLAVREDEGGSEQS